MEENLFKTEQTLKQIHDVLIDHIKEETSLTINADGTSYIYIRENGNSSWWFDDLILIILEKVEKKDKEIVNICLKKKVELFEIVKKNL
jgi:hypothetical protein